MGRIDDLDLKILSENYQKTQVSLFPGFQKKSILILLLFTAELND